MTYYDIAESIVKKLQEEGFVAYFTGGWVRDYLMDHLSDDIDIATSASTDEITPLFQKTIPLGVQFGIVVVVEQGHQFEIATFRQEQDYKDGRRPSKISPATAKEDAQRRDFTINGLFYDPIEKKVIDYVHGQEDLKLKIIKAIGNPHERFLEDRLRMIRAARYACRFHFAIDHDTREAIKLHAKDLFPSVAIERVWQEFEKTKKFGNFKSFLILLHELNLLNVIFKDLPNLSYNELTSLISPLDFYPKKAPLISKLLILFPNYTIEKKLSLSEYFKLSNQDKSFILFLEEVKKSILDPNPKRSTLIPLYAKEDFNIALNIVTAGFEKELRDPMIHFHEKKQQKFKKQIERIKNNNPLISSKILQEHGIMPGKAMGLILKEAQRISIEEHLDEIEPVMRLLKLSPYWPFNL